MPADKTRELNAREEDLDGRDDLNALRGLRVPVERKS